MTNKQLHNTLHDFYTTAEILKHGNQFEKSLAHTWLLANNIQKKAIQDAFPKPWALYADLDPNRRKP